MAGSTFALSDGRHRRSFSTPTAFLLPAAIFAWVALYGSKGADLDTDRTVIN
jgi:hypothetical protein